MACSLYQHPRSYHFSCKDALLSPFVSPYAVRHLHLARHDGASCMQRWGHRLIAAIQFIPVLGMLASLIERVAALVFRPLHLTSSQEELAAEEAHALAELANQGASNSSEPSEVVLRNYFECLADNSRPPLANIVSFLNTQESANLASIVAKNERNLIWEVQVKRQNIAVPSGIQPRLYFEKYQQARILLDFCKSIPACQKFIKDRERLNPIAQAQSLRNRLSKFPPEIARINTLSMMEKGLKAIPPEIKFFKNVSCLYLYKNDLRSVPVELFSLSNLEFLNLSENQIGSLPSEIRNLTKLRFLNVSNNKLVQLPIELNELTDLYELNASNNQLTSLPNTIGQMKNLLNLYVQHNQISVLPNEIANHPKISRIEFHGNPLRP